MRFVRVMFQSYYALVKDFMGFTGKNNLVERSLILLVMSINMAMLLTIILPCSIFYCLLCVYLKLKFGNSFGGLVYGQDAMMERKGDPVIINIIQIINVESVDKLLNSMQRRFYILFKSCRKLTYVVRSCMGYSYYLRSNLRFDDFISVIDHKEQQYLTKEILVDYMQQNRGNAKILGDRMFNMAIFKQPISWNKKDQYVVLTTVRHCLCDGAAIMALLKNFIYSDANFIDMRSNTEQKILNVKGLDDLHVHRNLLKMVCSSEKMYQPKYTKKYLLAWFVEDQVKYVPMIKAIKTQLKIGFSEVIFAAFSAALVNSIRQHYDNIDQITGGAVIRPLVESTMNMFRGNYNYHNVNNDSATISIKIPANLPNMKMLDWVYKLHAILQDVSGASESPMIYAVSKMLFLFPSPLVSAASRVNVGGLTFLISNMAGFDAAKFDIGQAEASGFNVPGLYGVDFLLGLFSLGDRFQVTLSSNTGMLKRNEELDEILANTFKNIDILSEEIHSTKGLE